jgi:phosphatidate phosphatase APP1
MISAVIKKAISGLFILGSTVANGSPLKSDETVIFFPTAAHLNSDLKWEVPIHQWVFEKEEQSILRKLTHKLLTEFAESLDISEEQANSEIFKKRVMWFIVDNERNKKLDIVVEGLSDTHSPQDSIHTLNTSAANGHGKTTIYIPKSSTQKKWIKYKALSEHESTQEFMGATQLIPETGLSVISDIDDTIKISEVLDKRALIRNTFLEEYQTTPNMPEFYQDLANQGAYFHYVSASPWQIYPSLKPFMEQHYPSGSFSLRDFRLKDSSIIKFLQSSKEYKLEKIRTILQKYPAHQFILIGDSGEHDPEIYAEIYNEFEGNIKRIMIRAVPGSDLDDTRFQTTFADVPGTIWRIVNDEESNMQALN